MGHADYINKLNNKT